MCTRTNGSSRASHVSAARSGQLPASYALRVLCCCRITAPTPMAAGATCVDPPPLILVPRSMTSKGEMRWRRDKVQMRET